MTKREAKRLAHRIAYRFVQQALDGGGREAFENFDSATDSDQKKIEDALDTIAQRHFELGAAPGPEPVAERTD